VHFDNVLLTKHISYNKGVLGKAAGELSNQPRLQIVEPFVEERLVNRPNPFGMGTDILYSVQYDKYNSRVTTKLGVYDYSGRLIKMLVDESKAPGMYGTTWDGNNAHGRKVDAGVYFYRLVAGDKTVIKKMIKCK
jgi:hypothetical protein